MTKRYLWTIVGAALCVGASPTGALAANAPQDWVCNKVGNKGECDNITLQGSRPKKDDEVRHLVWKATFKLWQDGAKYFPEFTSREWLVGFTKAELEWKLNEENGQPVLMKDAACTALEDASARPLATPPYSHFATKYPIELHLGKEGMHDWLIYPIGDKFVGQNGHSYCVIVRPADGGSHDGAVHGEG